MKKYLIYLAVTAVVLTVELIGIGIIASNKKNDVVVVTDTPKPGFETIPGYALVYASPSKVWADTPIAWMVLGFIATLLMAVAAFQFDGSTSKSGGPIALFVTGLLSLALVFGPYVIKKDSSDYEKRFCLKDYEANKGNFDSFFPSVDTAQDCK